MFINHTKGTNRNFMTLDSRKEQSLWNTLIIEAIKAKGKDMMYIPRALTNYDPIRGEDDQSIYPEAFSIEMYIRDAGGYSGEQYFASKFGMQNQSEITLTVSKTVWEEIVGQKNNQIRPNEGDLIWFTLDKRMFQIKFVDYKPFFYQVGDTQVYDLVCSMWEYSNEQLTTGFWDIDKLQYKYSTNGLDFAIELEDGVLGSQEDDLIVAQEYFTNEWNDPIEDNSEIVEENLEREIIDYSEKDPFSLDGVWKD